MDRVAETLELLRDASAKHKRVAVAYSGGKDSVVVLDLAMRTFEHVEAFFMYLVPGLECVESALDEARQRYKGLVIHQYPHWLTAKALRSGLYCFNSYRQDDLPDYKLRDVYDLAKHDAQATLVVTGAKRADSLWRRRSLSTTGWDDMLYPCIGWNKFDILGYCAKRGFKIGMSNTEKSATGVDLSAVQLCWLHDNHPEDFKRVCDVFPLAESVIWRRHWYGRETVK